MHTKYIFTQGYPDKMDFIQSFSSIYGSAAMAIVKFDLTL